MYASQIRLFNNLSKGARLVMCSFTRRVVALILVALSVFVTRLSAEAQDGVVILNVERQSGLGLVGVAAQDVILSWHRMPDLLVDSDHSEQTQGRVRSIFDWLWLEIEYGPRGDLVLHGLRGESSVHFTVDRDPWYVEVRPVMSGMTLEEYSKGRGLVESGRIREGGDLWLQIVQDESRKISWHLRCWLLLEVGRVFLKEGWYSDARRYYMAALDTARDTKSEVVVWDTLGDFHQQHEEFAEAQRAYRAALMIREATWGDSLGLAMSKSRLAEVYWFLGENDLAERFDQRAMALRTRIAPGLSLVLDMKNLGDGALYRNDLDTAEAYYSSALGMLESTAPSGATFAETLEALGHIAIRRKQFRAAEDFFRRSLAVYRLLWPESTVVARLLNDLGDVAYRLNRLEESAGYYRDALVVLEYQGSECIEIVETLENLGHIASRQDRLVEAQGYFDRGLEIEEELSRDSIRHGRLLYDLGEVSYRRGRLRAARKFYTRALEIYGKYDPGSLEVATVFRSLGAVDFALYEFDSAIVFYAMARSIFETEASESLALAGVLDCLGHAASRRTDHDIAAANEYFRQAVAIYEVRNPGGLELAGVLNDLGSIAYRQGEFVAAEHFIGRALGILEKEAPSSMGLVGMIVGLEDGSKEARFYRNGVRIIHGNLASQSCAHVHSMDAIGYIASFQDRRREAKKFDYPPLGIRVSLSTDSLEVAGRLGSLGDIALNLGDLGAAREYLERALEIQLKQGDGGSGLGSTLNALGGVAWSQGYVDLAERYWKRALSIYEQELPESSFVARVLRQVGRVAASRGDIELAESHYQRALDVSRSQLGSVDVAESLTSLGSLALTRGDLQLAEDYYLEALEIMSAIAPDRTTLARVLISVGGIAAKKGEIEAAEEYSGGAQDLYGGSILSSPEVADSLDSLGSVAEARGALDLAEEYYAQALDRREISAPGSLQVASSLSKLGSLKRLRGDLESAGRYHKQALDIRERMVPGSSLVARSLGELGLVAEFQGDLSLSVSYYERALVVHNEMGPFGIDKALVLYRLARVFNKGRDSDRAVAFYLRAIEVLEAQVERLGGSYATQDAFVNEYRMVYRDAVGALLRAGRKSEALYSLERFKGKSFRSMLTEREMTFSADVGGEIDSALRSIGSRYDRIQWRLASLDSRRHQQEIETLTSRLRRLRVEKNEIILKIREISPKLASLQYPHALELRAVQETLDPGTVMLSYNVRENETDLFCVSAGKELWGGVLPIGEKALRRMVDGFREMVLAPGAADDNRASSRLMSRGRELYKTLVEPVAGMIGEGQRVLFVPDGPLHLLPWGLLVRETEDSREGSGRAWQYLVEWKAAHTALSATVYAELKSRDIRAESGYEPFSISLMAFGDPVYPSSFASGRADSIADVRLRASVSRGIYDWQRLPHSRREVEEIASLFPGDRTAVYLGAEATETTLKSMAHNPRILHFAAHAHLDDRFPMDSALALSIPQELTEGQNNGLLQAWEIFERIRFNVDMVVLSACSSALGQELGGEGLVGLTRAFQYAGARSVVASLWNVEDESTAELMVRFYRYLNAGKSKSEALRAAQIELIEGPISVKGRLGKRDFTAPFYWAGFQIYGDWQ